MRQLAVHLGVSRQTLQAWMDKWPDFPVVERGSHGRNYVLDAGAVIAFLVKKREAQRSVHAERDQALAQLALPLAMDAGPAPELGGLSVRDRMEALKLHRLEREEAERTGHLVPAAVVSDQLSSALINWNRGLHNAVRNAGREHNLPDSLVRALDAKLTEAQRSFVRDLHKLLTGDGDDGG